jgi:hypothetical protein
MSARLLLLALVGVALAGCGVLDDEGPAGQKALDPAVYGPAQADPGAGSVSSTIPAPRLLEPSDTVARALDGGSIAVVDLTGTVDIEPESLDTASDITLEDVRWSRWAAEGASGVGRLRMLTCQPTCATGGFDEVAASVTLSGVKTCDGRRYFERGEVQIAAGDTPGGSGTQPATYLRAPC